MRKIVAASAAVLFLAVGTAAGTADARTPGPITNQVCGGQCDGGGSLPPCTAPLAGYYGYVIYGNSPTKSWFICDGRGNWIYHGEVPR